jgi:DHA1 family multidrug resistance protein-like MFS transporter
MNELSFVDKRLMMLFITLFTVALGFGVILPVLPFYTERLALGGGASPNSVTFHIGFLTSAFPFFQMFFAPLWGRWSDKLGRMPLIVAGLLGYVVMQFLIGISTSLWMLYLSRIIGGIFTSAIIPAGLALVTDLTSNENRALGIALAGTSYSIGVVAGPFIGGLLSQTDLHLYLEFGHFLINDYSVPFFFLAMVGLGLLPFAIKFLKDTDAVLEKKPAIARPSKWQKVVRDLFPFLLLSFIYQVALTLFESVFSIYSKNELQYDAITIGYGFMICALVMGLLQPLVVSKKVKKIISGRNQVILGFGLFGICLYLLIMAEQLFVVLPLIGLLAAGGALITPNITAIISLQGKKEAGGALGIQKSTDSLGQVIGPIAGSWLLTVNSSLPYMLTGTVAILVAVLFYKNKKLASVKV